MLRFAAFLFAVVSSVGVCSTVSRDLKYPLAFEPNRGQTDARVQYFARSGNMNAFITSAGYTLAANGYSVSMTVAGADPNTFHAGTALEGVSNYFKNGRAITGIPQYERVRARRVRPGMDVIYHGREGQVEYDFVFEPYAFDPDLLTMRFSGAGRPTIASNGDLVLTAGDVEFRHHKPIAWQDVGGVREPVACEYEVLASGEVRFQLANYDPRYALTIDPVLSYSTYLGGSGENLPSGIAADRFGAAYVAGTTQSADFPVTSGSRLGDKDVFVAKFSADGSTLLYSTFVGGAAEDVAQGIAVDSAGNAYVVGYTFSSGFARGYHGGGDGFVAKLGPAGIVVYATAIGGSSGDSGSAIAADSSGNAYVAGTTSSTGIATAGSAQRTLGGSQDEYVAKLDPSGTLSYLTYLGGADLECFGAIAVDGTGRAYVTGLTSSTDFPITANALKKTLGSGSLAFVTVVDPTGSSFEYSSFFGGALYTAGKAIAVAGGAVYLGGVTNSSDFPITPGAYANKPPGQASMASFVAKFATGTSWSVVYSTFLDLPSTYRSTYLNGLAVDAAGQAYVAGYTDSGWFPTTAGALRSVPPFFDNIDAFLTVLNSSGGALVYSTLLGGESGDFATGLALDGSGGAYIAGNTSSLLFPTSATARQASYPGSPPATPTYSVGFVSKISLDSPQACTFKISPATVNVPAEGKTLSFDVTADALCPWELYLDAGLTTTGPRKGLSSETRTVSVSVDVPPNTLETPRTLRVRLSISEYAEIRQAQVCKYTVEQPPIQPRMGRSFLVNLKTAPGCAWQAWLNASASWISLWGTQGAGSASLDLSMAANYGPLRIAWLTVANQRIPLIQWGFLPASGTDPNGAAATGDLVWQNEATHQVTLHYYGGTDGASDLGWDWLDTRGDAASRLVAIADFDLDGYPDLVWQNEATRQVTVHYYGGFNGTEEQTSKSLYAAGAPGWRVVAAADFNGDGVPDLVWQNEATRQVTVHYYGGPAGTVDQGFNWLYQGYAPGWKVVAVADFDGDGVPDLVWQNEATRQVTVHYYGGVGGATERSWRWLYPGSAPGWSVVAAQDFDGDGYPDLVWQADAVKQVTVHYYGGVEGATDRGWKFLNAGGAPGWTLARW